MFLFLFAKFWLYHTTYISTIILFIHKLHLYLKIIFASRHLSWSVFNSVCTNISTNMKWLNNNKLFVHRLFKNYLKKINIYGLIAIGGSTHLLRWRWRRLTHRRTHMCISQHPWWWCPWTQAGACTHPWRSSSSCSVWLVSRSSTTWLVC